MSNLLPSALPAYPDPSRLTRLQRVILARLDAATLRDGKEIARAVGRRWTGGFRGQLAELVRHGFIAKGPTGRGYRLPEMEDASDE